MRQYCAPAGAGEARAPADHPVRRPWAYTLPMNYQLIIKFWRPSLEDESFLPPLEAELRQALGDTVTLDGYDTSAKEFNLFVLTPDPRHTFRRVKSVLEAKGLLAGLSAAFRVEGGNQFTSLWPLRPMRKFQLP